MSCVLYEYTDVSTTLAVRQVKGIIFSGIIDKSKFTRLCHVHLTENRIIKAHKKIRKINYCDIHCMLQGALYKRSTGPHLVLRQIIMTLLHGKLLLMRKNE